VNLEIREPTDASPDGSAMGLFRIPFIFGQDKILKTDEFSKISSQRGYPLSLATLQALYEQKLLVPLFYVDDEPNQGLRIEMTPPFTTTVNYWVIEMAAEGRVRDCAKLEFASTRPFEIPSGETRETWWNGYLYSSWQLNRVPRALRALEQMERAKKDGVVFAQADQFRTEQLALCALATLYLPDILGRLVSPGSDLEPDLRSFIREVEVEQCLGVSGFDPTKLVASAEELLSQARTSDPIIDWWPLIRHSNISSWEKLKGIPLHSLWLRVSAEVFLRAHEDLARSGQLDPLPDLEGSQFRQSLHDRIKPHWKNERPLESELAVFGLSPHPRVLLLAEGDTEEIHFNALLKEINLNFPDRVRVQNAESSRANPDLLARYVIAPRPSHSLREYQWMLPPTVLVIAVDPENKWATLEGQVETKSKIKSAVKREVVRQGGEVTERELDLLVTLFVWPGNTYEFANFDDQELSEGLISLTSKKKVSFTMTDSWKRSVKRAISEARSQRINFSEKVGPLGVPDDKPELAQILLPGLIERFNKEYASQQLETPIFKVVQKVQELYSQFATGVFTFESKSR